MVVVVAALQAGGLEGDGYRTRNANHGSPHTSHEMFEGLTIIRATEVGHA